MKESGIKQKLIINILIISFVCFGLLGVIAYNRVASLMIEQSREDAMGLVEIAAYELDAESLMSIQSSDDEAYIEICNTLRKYTQNSFIQYIYTMKMDDEGVSFIVDADPVDPADFGEAYEFLEDMEPAFSGKVCCDKRVSSDKWGSYYSAYAPVFDDDGKVVAIVGCDISINDINVKKAKMRNLCVGLVCAFAIICFFSYSFVSKSIMQNDILTEVAGYGSFLRYGSRLIKKRRITEYTCLIVNIKDFRYINQRLGSSDSDLILRSYAKKQKNALARREIIARTGSDNFAILLKKKNEQGFLDVLSDMKIRIPNRDNEEIQIHSRCGIYRIDKIHTIDDILNACTLALNEARIPTSPDYVVFEDWMFDSMVEENKVLDEFQIGLQKEEFVVYYQPKVNSEDNRLCGAEALVRWFKGGKMIPPNKFIPVLEKDGCIVKLDFYVFKKVCQDIAYWVSQGISPVRISSNFSKMHLHDPGFADHILELVNKYQINPEYLEIELTESSGYSDQEALVKFVARMSEAHIHTSIDDFGTGYSSLSLLKDIDVDIIKIDKSFLDNLSKEDESNGKMIKNVIHMVNDLHREVICEGVETKEQLDFLKASGCYIIQGYLYDKPLPHEDFETRLKNPEYKSI